MIAQTDTTFRLIITAQLLAMGVVRAYFGAPAAEASTDAVPNGRAESRWLTALLGAFALLLFGSVIAYLANPLLLRWSAFEVAAPIRWIALLISCFGAAGEIWAAVSLGASYSPLLRVAGERVIVTAGPYRWIRHPLYAFGLPMMAGWGVTARSWFVLSIGTTLILILMIVRVPREEAMMLEGFGESYGEYMTRTGRFVPRLRCVHAQ